MRRVVSLIALTVFAALASAQEVAYTPSENPFQNEYEFSPGRVIELRADVQGVRLDTLSLVALEPAQAGKPVRCEIELAGNNMSSGKVEVSAVLLLEDTNSKGLQGGRITMEAFKVKAGRAFAQKQAVQVPDEVLSQASKVYILVQLQL
ncbi:MAG TPA: hypothetical protein PLS53_03060 [Thermoanaerobaculaceae bacterium]|nr:hypothetical protein [Thermoanaerobaculaceae bacterium]HPS77114.1 hypothetical protein [Thermoanaerobaculaceae bacterium]